VFDVNETLLDLDTIRPTFDRIFADPAALRRWFAALITYSEALTLAGVYVPFHRHRRCGIAEPINSSSGTPARRTSPLPHAIDPSCRDCRGAS
jgi:hypothetical protein